MGVTSKGAKRELTFDILGLGYRGFLGPSPKVLSKDWSTGLYLLIKLRSLFPLNELFDLYF